MAGIIPFLIIIIVIAITGANTKGKQNRSRQSGLGNHSPQGGTVPPPRPTQPQNGAVPSAQPLHTAEQDSQWEKNAARGRSFEQNADRRDETFGKTSNAADVMYTTQGCGCDASGEASAGRAHGSSNAIYDENLFYEEAQEMRRGRWT